MVGPGIWNTIGCSVNITNLFGKYILMTAFWHYFHHLSEDKTHYWSTLTGSVIRALLMNSNSHWFKKKPVENDIQQMPHKNVKPQNVNHEYRERLGGLGVNFFSDEYRYGRQKVNAMGQTYSAHKVMVSVGDTQALQTQVLVKDTNIKAPFQECII